MTADPTLEQERDFLLRSLDDLEQERAAGSIDDASYQALHDDYTARAAAVIRAIRDGVDTRPKTEVTSWKRRGLVIGGLVVFAVAAGVALAFALGARLPGQTASGNSGDPQTAESPGAGSDAQRVRLEAVVAENPDDIGSRLLLARYLESDDDLPGALEQYRAVIELDPVNADAHAQTGRILYLTATGAPATEAAQLVDSARAELDEAVRLDPEAADPRFFRAIVLANEFGDFAGAQGDLQRYLLAEPQGTFADQARQLLTDVTTALESPPTTQP